MIRIALILCFATSSIIAQENLLPIQRKLDDFNRDYLPEFTDLVLDRPFYFSGDQIWYALYVSNSSNDLTNVSGIAYVEISDASDSVLVRQKIRCREGKGHGDILLPRALPTGLYKISAYTLWMKNFANNRYSQSLMIINLDYPSLEGSQAPPKVFLNPGIEVMEDSLNVILTIRPNQSLKLLVRDREKIYAYEKLTLGIHRTIMIAKGLIGQDDVFALLIDETDSVIEEKRILEAGSYVPIISLNKQYYKPREKVELTVALFDENKNPINGSFSISVRSDDGNYFHSMETAKLGAQFLAPIQKPLYFDREILLYPSSSRSLSRMNFKVAKDQKGFPLYLSDLAKVSVKELALRRKTMNAYSVQPSHVRDINYLMTFDISYRIRDYSQIKLLKDFINEIIPQVKVKILNGEKVFRVRNSDNPDNIYFFKESPLILIDDNISTAQDVLLLECQNVESLDVLWSEERINSLGIFSLADYGVVSIRTKSGMISDKNKGLFADIQTPLKFSNTPFNGKDEGELPLFYEPTFWAPDVKLKGKAIVNFYLSDIAGDHIVEINGYTTSGQRLAAKATLTIKP